MGFTHGTSKVEIDSYSWGLENGGYHHKVKLSDEEQSMLLQSLLMTHSTIYFSYSKIDENKAEGTGQLGADIPEEDLININSPHNIISRLIHVLTGKSADQIFAEEEARYAKEENLIQWWKNGDHPNDGPRNQEGKVVRYYRNPDIDGTTIHEECRRLYEDHGWIEGDKPNDSAWGTIVCPGTYVGANIKPMHERV